MTTNSIAAFQMFVQEYSNSKDLDNACKNAGDWIDTKQDEADCLKLITKWCAGELIAHSNVVNDNGTIQKIKCIYEGKDFAIITKI